MGNKYWLSPVPDLDDFGIPIKDEFIDGKTLYGSWAIMTLYSWRRASHKILGTGWGQRYKKQANGRWLKIEG